MSECGDHFILIKSYKKSKFLAKIRKLLASRDESRVFEGIQEVVSKDLNTNSES